MARTAPSRQPAQVQLPPIEENQDEIIESDSDNMDADPQISVTTEAPHPSLLADLFGPDPDGGSVIRVVRTHPTEWEGIRIQGYLGTLPPGEGIDYLLHKYGGGRYSVQQFKGQKYIQARSVTISGPPRLSAPTPERAESGLAGSQGTRKESEEDYFNRLRRLMIEKKILDSMSAGPSDKLMEILVAKLAGPGADANPPDPLETMTKMLESMARLREAFPGESGGGSGSLDLMGLLGKAIDALPALVTAKAAQQPPRRITAPPQPQIAVQEALPAPPIVQPTQEVQTVANPMAMAQTAIGTLVRAYLEEPPLPADRTVDTLKAVINFTPDVIETLRKYKTALYDGALLALHNEIEADPQLDESFRLFFETVFQNLTEEQTQQP